MKAQILSVRKSLFVLAALVLPADMGSAASISILTGPTSGVSGGVIDDSSSFAFSQVSPAWVKVTGAGDYTSTGTDSAITLSVGGLISALVGESISIDYDFTFSFTGAGQVNWTLTSVLFGSIAGPGDSGGPITSADSGNFTGTKSVAVPLSLPGVSWSALLTANWTGAAPGDKLTFTIPNNSIDIAVVPESSSLMLLGLGGVLIARRRR